MTDCYFCLTNISGYNRKTKNSITYPSVQSVTFPILINGESDQDYIDDHNVEREIEVSIDEVSVDKNTENVLMEKEEQEDVPLESEEVEEREQVDMSEENHRGFNQGELIDLVRDLGFSKESSELLASRLKGKNCLAPKTRISL